MSTHPLYMTKSLYFHAEKRGFKVVPVYTIQIVSIFFKLVAKSDKMLDKPRILSVIHQLV